MLRNLPKLKRKNSEKIFKEYKSCNLYIETILPGLDTTCELLGKEQRNNGSWFNNPRISSITLLALSKYYEISRNEDYKFILRRGANYLMQTLNELNNQILCKKEIIRLPEIVFTYLEILITLTKLNNFNLITINNTTNETIKKAIPLLVDKIYKHAYSLRNLKLFSTLIDAIFSLCNDFLNDTRLFERIEKIIDLMIDIVLKDLDSEDVPYFILTANNLLKNRKWKKIIEKIWYTNVSNRADKWQNADLKSSLFLLAKNYILHDIKSDKRSIKSLALSISLLQELMELKDNIGEEELSKILKMVHSEILKFKNNLLINKNNVQDIYPHIMLVYSILQTNYSKMIMISSKYFDELRHAYKWYINEKKDKNILFVEKWKYITANVILLLLLAITLVTIHAFKNLAATAIMIPVAMTVAISLIFSCTNSKT